jgi:ubiquitin carboxyl-terminal hydrolase 7
VPLLREIVLGAKDEVVDVEVEVDDEEAAANEQPTDDCEHHLDEAAALDEIEQATDSVDRESTTSLPKKTIIKQELRPISPALRALQQTFKSLDPNSGHSSGSTQVLCRSLGINPYIQQDGQEFWKLFVPEVDYDKLTELYTGHYDDYIREILETNIAYGEEKKDDDNLMVEQVQPRERVRTDPFLDLSIPVTEGSG